LNVRKTERTGRSAALIAHRGGASPDTTPEKFRRRLEADVAFWTPVVEALGLRID